MTRIPAFADIAFDAGNGASTRPSGAAPWQTPEGIAVKPVYGPEDIARLDFLDGMPGVAPYLRGPYPTMYVQRPWTVRAIFRLLNGRGLERLLSPQPRRRPAGRVHRLRPCHPSRLRLRPSARHRRCRHGRRRHRLDLRHAHPVRPHPARQGLRVDDHERRGAPGARALHRRRRRARRAAGGAVRHHSERHPERVHGAEHLHLSARTLDAHRLRHLRLHLEEDAEVQLDLDLRLSHAGGRSDRRPRARLHACRRHRICARRRQAGHGRRCFRAAPLLLLGDRHELLHGDRQDARRPAALGQAHGRGVQAERPALARAPHPLPDERLEPRRPRRVQQRGAHLRRGDGGDPRPYPVAAHQCAGRSAGAADRLLRPHRPQHPAHAASTSPAPPASSILGAAASMSSG